MGNVMSPPVLPALHVIPVAVAPGAGTRVETPVDPVGDRVIPPVRQCPGNLILEEKRPSPAPGKTAKWIPKDDNDRNPITI
jgi:hypothetical protein